MAQRVMSPVARRERERPAPPDPVVQFVLPAEGSLPGSAVQRVWRNDAALTRPTAVMLPLLRDPVAQRPDRCTGDPAVPLLGKRVE